MTDVVITVRGAFDSFHPPERATVQVALSVDGANKTTVHSTVTESAAQVSAEIGPLFDREQGPVTWWSSDQVRTWAERPFNQDGKQLPLVHHAVVSYQVKFKDFDAMSDWISRVSTITGVSVSGIDWALTEKLKIELRDAARVAAVRDARDKANAYAHSLELGDVRPVAIADVGMLGDASSPAPVTVGLARRTMAYSAPAGPELDFTPQDIEVSASVDARFVAS